MADFESEASRLVLKGAAATASGFVVRLSARLPFLFLAAKFYGAETFGAYVVAIAVVEGAACLGGFALNRTLFHFLDDPKSIAMARPAQIVINSIYIAIGVSACLVAVIWGFLLIFSNNDPGNGLIATHIAVLVPAVIFLSILDILFAATRWTKAIRYSIIGTSIVQPYILTAVAAAAYFGGITRYGLLVGYWVSITALLAYAIYAFRRCYSGIQILDFNISSPVIRAIFHHNKAAAISATIHGMQSRLDLYFVGFLLGETGAGLYGLCREFVAITKKVRQSFENMLTPVVSQAFSRSAQEASRRIVGASELILAIQGPVLIVILAAGASILSIFGPEFVIAYWALVILVLAEGLEAVLGPGDIMLVLRKPAAELWLTIGGVIVGAVSCWLLIPEFGLAGASLAVLAWFFVVAVARIICLQILFGVTALSRNMGVIFFVNLVSAIAVIFMIGPETLSAPVFNAFAFFLGLAGCATGAVITRPWRPVVAKNSGPGMGLAD